MTGRKFGWWLASMALCACDGGGGKPASNEAAADTGTRVLAPGNGEANLLPLFPLRPGFDNGDRHLEPPVLRGAELVYPWTGNLRAVPEFVANYSVDPEFLVERSDGVYSLGFAGRMRDPALLVPKTIRAGMKWHTATREIYGQLPTFGSTCVVDTPVRLHGDPAQPRLWTINCEADKPLCQGVVYQYVEGIGPTNFAPIDPDAPPEFPVQPGQEPPKPAAKPRVLALTQLGGAIASGFAAEHVTAVIAAGADGKDFVRLRLTGRGQGLATGGSLNAKGQTEFSVTVKTFVRQYRCLHILGDKVSEPQFTVPNGAELSEAIPPLLDAACPDADYAAVKADGTFESIAPSAMFKAHFVGGTGNVVEGTPLNFHGLVAGSDGVQVLASVANDTYLGRIDPVNPGFKLADAGVVNLGSIRSGLRAHGGGDRFHFDPDGAGGQYVAAFGANGWSWAHWRDGHLWGARWAGPPGYRSHAVSREGHETYVTTLAGRIERVHATADGVRFEPIGDAALPPGHVLVGAVRQGSTLYVVTQGGFLGGDPGLSGSATKCGTLDGKNGRMRIGATYLFKAALPTSPYANPPVATAGAIALTGGSAGEVCTFGSGWPELSDPKQAAEQYGAVLTTANCALPVAGSKLFEAAPLPGVGPTRMVAQAKFAAPAIKSEVDPGGIYAPLAGGGSVGRGLVFRAANIVEADAVHYGKGIAADLSGAGLWFTDNAQGTCNGCLQLGLQGRNKAVLFKPRPVKDLGLEIVNPSGVAVIGGGVWWNGSMLRSDGTETVMPPTKWTSKDAAVERIVAVWPSGAMAGVATRTAPPYGSWLWYADDKGQVSAKSELWQPNGADFAGTNGAKLVVLLATGPGGKQAPTLLTLDAAGVLQATDLDTALTSLLFPANDVTKSRAFANDSKGQLYAACATLGANPGAPAALAVVRFDEPAPKVFADWTAAELAAVGKFSVLRIEDGEFLLANSVDMPGDPPLTFVALARNAR